MVIFLRDPLTAQPHEPDISALIRLCDVYAIPLATNMRTAEVLIHGLDRGALQWRSIIHEKQGEKNAILNQTFYEKDSAFLEFRGCIFNLA